MYVCINISYIYIYIYISVGFRRSCQGLKPSVRKPRGRVVSRGGFSDASPS